MDIYAQRLAKHKSDGCLGGDILRDFYFLFFYLDSPCFFKKPIWLYRFCKCSFIFKRRKAFFKSRFGEQIVHTFMHTNYKSAYSFSDTGYWPTTGIPVSS